MKQSNLPGNTNPNKTDHLDKYFDELRNEDHSSTFSATRQWLQTTNNKLQTKKPERIYSNMKKYFAANKLKLAYTFLILAFVVAACNYPVTQQETVSDVITWTVDKENSEALTKLQNFDWFKSGSFTQSEVNINGNTSINYKFIVPKESHDRIPQIKNQLESVNGVRDVRLVPINETITRPVYSALLNNIFKIDINATNMSDQELANEVSAQLKNAGIENAQIDFEKSPDGSRRIRLFVPHQELKKEGGFDMTIDDGGNKTRIKEMRKEGAGDKFRNKSDAEIRDMVREDISKDLRDDQIEIIRKGENVMIKVKREDAHGNDKLEIEKDVR